MAARLRKAGAERWFSIRQSRFYSRGLTRECNGGVRKFINSFIHFDSSDIVSSRILPRAVPPVGVTSLS
jgi:hypothetical protein